ncbi:hypothetical protein [Photorhabdus sp. MH8.4]
MIWRSDQETGYSAVADAIHAELAASPGHRQQRCHAGGYWVISEEENTQQTNFMTKSSDNTQMIKTFNDRRWRGHIDFPAIRQIEVTDQNWRPPSISSTQ